MKSPQLILITTLSLVGCCDEHPLPFEKDQIKNSKPDEDSKSSPLTFTIIHGSLPTPPEKFRRITEAVYPLIKHEKNPPFEAYTETVPRSNNATFDLVPIPGGEFIMGSSPDDPDHKPDELPTHRVKLDPFWMATTETTWKVYSHFVMQSGPDGRYIGRDEFGFRLNEESLSNRRHQRAERAICPFSSRPRKSTRQHELKPQ